MDITVDPQTQCVVLDNVVLPLRLSADFITPDFEDAMAYWPTYARLCISRQIVPRPARPYLLLLIKEVVKAGCRPGRTDDEWLRRIAEHFGLEKMGDWFTQGSYVTKGLDQ